MANYLHWDTAPLLRIGKKDKWLLKDAYEGTHIYGATGAGKSSGSGQAIAIAMLNAGLGGLVLAAKPDEFGRWLSYAKACGREKSIIRFCPEAGSGFNFLEYEMTFGEGGVKNVVSLLETVLKFTETSNLGNNEKEKFWDLSIRELLRNTISALFHAYGRIDLDEIMQMVQSGPTAPKQWGQQSWRNDSFCFQTLEKMAGKPVHPVDHREGRVITDYWRYTFAQADPKTRENIRISFTSRIGQLFSGEEYKLMCTHTNVVPEMSFDPGAIIVIDMPTQIWHETGILVQKIFKYMWQRAAQRRQIHKKSRPAFLFADEAHVLATAEDATFQSMARSSRICTVYLSQGIDGYLHQIGGSNPQAAVDALMGHFQTKIFHANSSSNTNEWASKLIGRSIQTRHSTTSGENTGYSKSRSHGRTLSPHEYEFGLMGPGQRNRGKDSGASSGTSYSESTNEVLELEIEPGDFARGMATGGPDWKFKVDGILMKTSARFGPKKKNWVKLQFSQR